MALRGDQSLSWKCMGKMMINHILKASNAIICEITMQAVSNNEDFKSYTKAKRNVQTLTQK